MKWKLCIVAMLLLLSGSNLISQTVLNTNLADNKVIDAGFKTLNYKKPVMRLSEFRHTPVILDFFSIYCGSCIAELPRLDTLQKIYGNRLQFIVVSSEPMADVKKFLSKNRRAKNISLPFITEDTLLEKVFPFKIIPHEVWLDGNFTVKAITDQYEVSEANIDKLINTGALTLPLKQDELAFTTALPLFEQGNGGTQDPLVCRSLLSRYLPGVPAASGQEAKGKTQRFYFINLPLYSLYEAAWGVPGNRVISNIPDTIDRITQHTAWNTNWLYSYEITLPENYPIASRNLLMQQDLQRYTGFKARMEDRAIHCWLLKKAPVIKRDIPYTPPADAMINVGKGDSTALLALNINVALSDSRTPPLILDSVKGMLDTSIVFSPQERSITAVQEVLQAYGYTLEPYEVTIPMLVISNKQD